MKEFGNWLKKVDLLYYATGFAVILAFLATVHTVLYRQVPAGNQEAFAHLRGMIEGAFVGGLVGYFFVKSKNSNSTPQ
jgi:hypothetical protein